MVAERKTRTDAWESELSEEEQWQVYDRLRSFPVGQVQEWVKEQHGVDASRSSMYRFAARMRERESEHRIETALSVKENVRRQMQQVGDMDEELQYAYEQLAMESAMRGDEQAGIRYLSMATRYSEGRIEREKLRLKQEAEARAKEELALAREKFEAAERRAAQADEAEKVVRDEVDPAERERRLKQIFGLS